LQQWYDNLNIADDRGSHILVKAELNTTEEEVYGIGWADKKMFAFVFNVGLTKPGNK